MALGESSNGGGLESSNDWRGPALPSPPKVIIFALVDDWGWELWPDRRVGADEDGMRTLYCQLNGQPIALKKT